MRRRLLVATMMLLATPAMANDVLLLEHLVQQSTATAISMESRLYSFFKKNEVQNPKLWASLLADHPKPKLMAAIVTVESRGNPKAVNKRSGAAGAFQVMPAWKRKLKVKGSLLDPTVNLHTATRVYNIHLEDANYNQHRALTDYSGGSKWYAKKITKLMGEI